GFKTALAGRTRNRKRRSNELKQQRKSATVEKTDVETPDSAESRLHALSRARAMIIPSVAAGLLFAFSRTLWSYATIAEVYTLNTLLILMIFVLMFRWRRGILKAGTATGSSKDLQKHDRWLNSAAFVFGLGLGVHHVSVALMLPALAWLVLA